MTEIDKTVEEAWHQDALAAVLPFESWERLPGESGAAYSAFRAYRDLGPERNIRKACQFRKAELATEFDGIGGGDTEQRQDSKPSNSRQMVEKRYRMYRNWAVRFRWRERAADYDRYTEKLKQGEVRKTIEAQGELHRAVTGKMLEVVYKKLELMSPADLSQGTVTEWVETAIRAEREAAGLVAPNGKAEPKQGEINFTPEFEGL
jgi:hypothetical protein